MPAKKPKPDEKPQFERFIETSKEIGAGETDEALEKVFEKFIPKIPPHQKERPS
jgi:hypothetical protein